MILRRGIQSNNGLAQDNGEPLDFARGGSRGGEPVEPRSRTMTLRQQGAPTRRTMNPVTSLKINSDMGGFMYKIGDVTG